MANGDDTDGNRDHFDLKRFTDAQERVYATALAEIKKGNKRSHWMWFIFPQIEGLGFSPTSRYYSIKSIEEARAYLAHPVLGERLRECAEALLTVEGRSASAIFGSPDDMKLQSSMTLFACVDDAPNPLFVKVLEKYYRGERDTRTIQILETIKGRYSSTVKSIMNKEEIE